MNKLIKGDTLKCLRKLPSESVQTCICSPPYWGLRDYGVAGQLGLEPTPESYVARMVEVFAEVRRVLRPDGTLWLNIGDSYASGEVGRHDQKSGEWMTGSAAVKGSGERRQYFRPSGLKAKDLVGIPWRLAFALQADGWYLRSDIIWHKPNPMPESVRDRPTKAHEYVFLLSKSARYFWDAEAVREEASEPHRPPQPGYARACIGDPYGKQNRGLWNPSPGRNVRSVWTITPKPFRGAHFATFPPALVERCVKAGTSERGACPQCGKPWERVTERIRAGKPVVFCPKSIRYGGRGSKSSGLREPGWRKREQASSRSLGFRRACSCPAAAPVPCVVLDPFLGSGTTAAVSRSLGRDCVGIDLNPKYLTMARQRVKVALCG
jgi:DNA modification methylase